MLLDPNAMPNESQAATNKSIPNDPLLLCLIALAKIHHKTFSINALTAGLPLTNNMLTPDLFVRAAERIGIEAEIEKKALNKISSNKLPVVLLLANNSACVLLDINDDDTAQIIDPTKGEQVQEINLKTLKQQYLGRAITTKPIYEFSDRSEEVLEPRSNNWFWKVIWRAMPIYSEVLFASFLINLFALAVPLFAMNVYDRVVPNHAVDTLWVLSIGVAVAFIFDFILRTIRAYFIDSAGKNIDTKLSSKIFEQIMGLQMSVRPSSVGAFVNTVQSFEAFRDFITSTTITVLVDLPFTVLYLAIIAMIGGTLVFIPLAMIPLIIVIGLFLQMPLNELTKESYRHSAEKQAILIESLGGVEAIKAGSAEGVMQRRWEQVANLAAKLSVKLRLVANSSINFSIFAQQMTYVIVVIFGVYKITNGEITVGALIACSILAGRALAPMSQVASLLTRYHQSVHALKSIDSIMKLPVDRPKHKTLLHRSHVKGDIEFKGVTFVYPNQPIAAIYKASFHIRPGERVGIIGRIGSGKTTIAKLVLGLYQATEGSILVDGTEIQQFDPADLRRNIGYVQQDVVLFYGTIKENITFGSTYVTDEDIIKAAKIAGVNRFVDPHPAGFGRQVGERGMYLSGGQRQSIAVARAIVLNPPVLLLDEPSASMDDSTETQLKQQLMTYVKDKTLILETHKVSMLDLVDRLIVLEAGQVVADGPKEMVLQALLEGKIKVPSLQVSP